MKLTITRTGAKTSSAFAPYQELAGSLSAQRSEWADPHSGFLHLRFETNPDGFRRSEFTANVSHSRFEEIAKLMVEANPVAAIKAFASALQTANVQEIPTELHRIRDIGVAS
ncbi:MAG TPA: hypothetical protein VFA57_15700 [Pseudolabrys sp.]|jgi:hypothetical protein|nr:hypothetical protein [Pseudolabrys sp.]